MTQPEPPKTESTLFVRLLVSALEGVKMKKMVRVRNAAHNVDLE